MKFLSDHYATYSFSHSNTGNSAERKNKFLEDGFIWTLTGRKKKLRKSSGESPRQNGGAKSPGLFCEPFGLPISHMRRNAMAAARYWGDEKQTDAIYAVYLRKVRYVPPNNYQGITHFRPLNPDYGYSNDTDHLQWETVKEKVIKAGTLAKLVEFLILPDGEMDTRHFNVLFNTYRAVAAAFDVLRLILARYSGVDSEKFPAKNQKVKMRQLDSLRSVLNFWIDMFPEDFSEPPHYLCLMELIEFGRMHNPHLQDIFVKAARSRERFARDSVVGGGSSNDKCYTIEKHSLALQLESLDYLLSPGRHQVSDASQMDPVVTAEQLTYWDAELFKRLLPYQCQGCFWSRRHKTRKSSETVHTVKATVDQFNAVSRRVMTSVVFPECKPGVRAKIICRWIEVARELRILKNFSSLKAVLSGLQCEPVHRLKQTWAFVPNEDIIEFEQLSRIFSSDEEDDEGARKILEKEGTAKTVNGISPSPLRHGPRKHRRAKSDMSEAQGTVPYLGTFLTDLTMIDEALADKTEDGLINFEKRRKEFDVIAQLKLFQSAARSYHFQMDPKFCNWFQCLPCLPEKDCFRRSFDVEKPSVSTPEATPSRLKKHPSNPSHLRKSSTLSKIFLSMVQGTDGDSSSAGEEDAWFSLVPPTPHKGAKGSPASVVGGSVGNGAIPQSPSTLSTMSSVSAGKSVFYAGGSEFNPSEFFGGTDGMKVQAPKIKDFLTPNFIPKLKHSSVSSDMIGRSSKTSFGSVGKKGGALRGRSSSAADELTPRSLGKPGVADSSYILRITLDEELRQGPAEAQKCIRLENGDRMPWLIEKALTKHLISLDTARTSDYCLVQVLENGKEFVLPEKCNPYYAVVAGDNVRSLNFVLRKKGTQQNGNNSSGNTAFLRKKKRKKSTLLRWSSGFL